MSKHEPIYEVTLKHTQKVCLAKLIWVDCVYCPIDGYFTTLITGNEYLNDLNQSPTKDAFYRLYPHNFSKIRLLPNEETPT